VAAVHNRCVATVIAIYCVSITDYVAMQLSCATLTIAVANRCCLCCTLQLEEDATAAAAASAASSKGKAAAGGSSSANGASRRTASATPVEETVDEEESGMHAITHLSKQPPSLQGQLRNYQVRGCTIAYCIDC
jgi:hypothetical protein